MILDWLAQVLRSRYVALLEEEVERLRAENRALINSLLGTAGFPPLELHEGKSAPAAIPRLRRRSWHQIAALREFGTAANTEIRTKLWPEADTFVIPGRVPRAGHRPLKLPLDSLGPISDIMLRIGCGSGLRGHSE